MFLIEDRTSLSTTWCLNLKLPQPRTVWNLAFTKSSITTYNCFWKYKPYYSLLHLCFCHQFSFTHSYIHDALVLLFKCFNVLIYTLLYPLHHYLSIYCYFLTVSLKSLEVCNETQIYQAISFKHHILTSLHIKLYQTAPLNLDQQALDPSAAF